jgi:hypothetical protein
VLRDKIKDEWVAFLAAVEKLRRYCREISKVLQDQNGVLANSGQGAEKKRKAESGGVEVRFQRVEP